MTEPDQPLHRVIAQLKEPVAISPELTDRVMAEVRRLPVPASESSPAPVSWWRRRWTLQVSPLGGLAAAASLTGLLFASQWLGRRMAPAAQPSALAATSQASSTQFVLVAPGAKAVSLVGDFNDWSVTATPLARADGDGVWWVTVPLAPGRYRYAFVVDGAIWRSDPESPAAEDEFGRPNSVVTIGGA
jgi:hypothetical protein